MTFDPLVITRLRQPVGVPLDSLDFDPGDSRFFQKRDILILKGYIHEQRETPVKELTQMLLKQRFVAHSPRVLGAHIASWGEESIGDLFEEIYREGKYPHEMLLGIPVTYDPDLPTGVLLLVSCPREGRVEIGRIVTRGPDAL